MISSLVAHQRKARAMKITDVRLQRYGQRSEEGSLPRAEIQVVQVDTDEGITGTGFLTASNSPASPNSELLAGLVRHNLRSIVLGQDPVLNEALWRRMYEQLAPRRGSRGLLLQCIASGRLRSLGHQGAAARPPVGGSFRRAPRTRPDLRQRRAPDLA
jgi:hypothetical protein